MDRGGDNTQAMVRCSCAFSALKYAKAIRESMFLIIIAEQGEAFDLFFLKMFFHCFIKKAWEATGLIISAPQDHTIIILEYWYH